jgi:hypothetical protein
MGVDLSALPSTRHVRAQVRRGWIRLHSAIIGLLVVGCGFGVAKLLLAAGLEHMALRYALVVTVAYGVMLVLVRAWLALTHERERLETVAENADAALDGADVLLPRSGGGWLDGARSADWASFALDDIGGRVAALVALAAIALVAGFGIYLIVLAPEVLVDAAVAWAIAAGAAKKAEPDDDGWWLTAVLKRTWWVLVLCLAVAIALGSYIESAHPDARTLKEAIVLMLGPR